MSLINEALKRARDDTVRREAAARGVPLVPSPVARSRTGWLAAAVLALSVALMISLILLIQVNRRISSVDASSEVPSPVASANSRVPDGGAGGALERPEPGPQAPPPASEPAVRSAIGETDSTRVSGEAVRSQPSPASALSAPGADPAARSQATPQVPAAPPALDSAATAPSAGTEAVVDSQPSAPRVFVRRAELAGGQTLDLGGIAWSETGPYALLNGKVVGTGEFVWGYRVTEIGPQQVVLSTETERLVLRLK